MLKTIKRFVNSFLDVFRLCLIILTFIVVLAIVLKVFNVNVTIINSSAAWICKTISTFFNWLATLV